MCVKLGVTHIKGKWLQLFENRVLRAVNGSKREEDTAVYRKPHNKVLNNLQSFQNTIMIK
jgi:hypothetical protein